MGFFTERIDGAKTIFTIRQHERTVGLGFVGCNVVQVLRKIIHRPVAVDDDTVFVGTRRRIRIDIGRDARQWDGSSSRATTTTKAAVEPSPNDTEDIHGANFHPG